MVVWIYIKTHSKGKCDGSVGVLWDKMMQEMNYNETNGIVIGPECSRIFAEVIMQYVDQMVEQQLLIKMASPKQGRL